MLSLHRTAKDYGKRPSEIFKVSDEWAAYKFDSAVSWFGNYVENKLMEVDKAGKPKHNLEDLLKDKTEQDKQQNMINNLEALFGPIEVR